VDSFSNISDSISSQNTKSKKRYIFINATTKNLNKLVFSRNNQMLIWNKDKSEKYFYRLGVHTIILGGFDAFTTFDFVLSDDELTIGDYYNKMTRYIKFKRRK